MVRDYSELGLPASVTSRVKFSPIEDVGLALLRRGLPGVHSVSLIPLSIPSLFVLVRRVQEMGNYDGQRPLVDEAEFSAHIYSEDPDGDEKASLVADAVMDVMTEAFLNHWRLYDAEGGHLGSVNKIVCTQGPYRVTDWATSAGPVQYADLPTGDWRYEIRFRIRMNPPRN